MLSKTQISFLRSLHQKKYRDIHKQFFVEGRKLAQEVLRSNLAVTGLYGTGSWIMAHQQELDKFRSIVHEITPSELERISDLSTPNEVFITCRIPEYGHPDFHQIEGPVLALDQVQDPGNLGTIIRTCDWFGIRTILCSEGTVELYNPKVLQATMGSFTRVRVHYGSLAGFIEASGKGFKVYGTASGGASLFDMELEQRAIIIVGNESKGISPDLTPFLMQSIGIPSAGPGAESLNASVAAAIVISEFAKQSGRLNKK